MGKKSKNVQKGKGEKKELQALSRRIKVNLNKICLSINLFNILILILLN